MQTANKAWLPLGAKLTDAQYASFRAGNLYVNVHTAAHPGGELRAQLKPQPPVIVSENLVNYPGQMALGDMAVGSGPYRRKLWVLT